jgi:hypothetical protein
MRPVPAACRASDRPDVCRLRGCAEAAGGSVARPARIAPLGEE